MDPRTLPSWLGRKWASLSRGKAGGLSSWIVLHLVAALLLSTCILTTGPLLFRAALLPYAVSLLGILRSLRHSQRELAHVLARAQEEASGSTVECPRLRQFGPLGSSVEELIRDLNDARKELSRRHLDLVKIIALAMEARDAYTQGHCLRVRYLTRRMLKLLRVDGHYGELTEAAALLHDLGKIGIPDALLLKRTKLTPEEYNRIMFHVDIGVEILQAISSLRELARFVRHHHEHYDGSGYPDGLKGEDIPLASRVIAVADAVDAMRSTRPYRPRLSLEATVAELTRNRGTQFDPQVVDAAIKVLSTVPSAPQAKDGPPSLPGGSDLEAPPQSREPVELLVAAGS